MLNRCSKLLRRLNNKPLIKHYATGLGQDGNKHKNDDFLTGNGNVYIDEMYKEWKRDPSSVHVSWRAYFTALSEGKPHGEAFAHPPSLVSNLKSQDSTITGDKKQIMDHLKVQLLVRAYQVRGHLRAKLDPLNIMQAEKDFGAAPELDPQFYGFSEADLERTFYLGEGVLPRFTTESGEMRLKDILSIAKEIYCGPIGYEFIHIEDRAMCNWLRGKIEIPKPEEFTLKEKELILDRLIWADSFERFVAKKYPAEKRFGLEGGESLIPGLKALIDLSVELGTMSIVMGMPHRGRLNVLTNVIRKPFESIFCEFMGIIDPSIESSGDVKYHLGMSYERPTPSGRRVNISLVANPSHLEAVDPVVLGKVRALQFERGDNQDARREVMGLLLHGDAAFAAQGVVYETMGMSQLPSYTTGGTIHVIVNNQIGFTTDPRFARSTPYPSDLAKAIEAPIFHVNGDDVEAVVRVFRLAAEWRATFHRDVVIDLVCYRRHGHNEVDQPAFTQPRMYSAISKKSSCLDLYVDKLLQEKALTLDAIEANKKRVWEHLEEVFEASKHHTPTIKEWQTSTWTGFKSPKELSVLNVNSAPTGVDVATLKKLGLNITSIPSNVKPHPGIVKIMEARRQSISEGENIDMPTAESLAFATLLQEGFHVRLSGQDVERGTFSQRHAVIVDTHTEARHIPLAFSQSEPSSKLAPFTVCNSSLSEFGVLGFELGYSLVSPNQLVIWEAQFGDFANSAQVIIDQFLASGERKWLQRTGLTLMLPHGYDGAGPEHSNCHVERFLSLCDDNPLKVPDMDRALQNCNMQVVYPSTPASLFHVLRRQVHREYRKPLIVLSSKSLLRHPMARSSLEGMQSGTKFEWVIDDPAVIDKHEITSMVLCSGQVYYALERARQANGITNVALVRLEQLSPFPYSDLSRIIPEYKNLTRLTWCQEEPLNLGAWQYVQPRLQTLLARMMKNTQIMDVHYAGRDPTAAVATGYKVKHMQEEDQLLRDALQPGSKIKGHQHGIVLFE